MVLEDHCGFFARHRAFAVGLAALEEPSSGVGVELLVSMGLRRWKKRALAPTRSSWCWWACGAGRDELWRRHGALGVGGLAALEETSSGVGVELLVLGRWRGSGDSGGSLAFFIYDVELFSWRGALVLV
jgi:hypothetical protein